MTEEQFKQLKASLSAITLIITVYGTVMLIGFVWLTFKI